MKLFDGMLGIGVTNFHLWTRVFTPKRSDKIGGRISPEKKTSTIDGNKFLDPQLLEKKKPAENGYPST